MERFVLDSTCFEQKKIQLVGQKERQKKQKTKREKQRQRFPMRMNVFL
jgi:hypothetical protein